MLWEHKRKHKYTLFLSKKLSADSNPTHAGLWNSLKNFSSVCDDSHNHLKRPKLELFG